MIIIRKKYLIILFVISYMFHINYSIAQRNKEIGIDEKLGRILPSDLTFVTSDNDTITLGEIIDKPVLLAPIYYECPGVCNPLQNELAWIIDKLDLIPGKDYKIISMSFNYRESPSLAAKWKKNFLQSMKKKINENDWIFLTGDSINVYSFTDTIGFYFKKNNANQFIHPSVLIAISPERKITRYILGPTFNPFDIKMALIEAKANKTAPTVTKVLEFCYSYDPESKKYTFNLLRIIGIIMLLGIGIFVTILLLRSKPKKME